MRSCWQYEFGILPHCTCFQLLIKSTSKTDISRVWAGDNADLLRYPLEDEGNINRQRARVGYFQVGFSRLGCILPAAQCGSLIVATRLWCPGRSGMLAACFVFWTPEVFWLCFNHLFCSIKYQVHCFSLWYTWDEKMFENNLMKLSR